MNNKIDENRNNKNKIRHWCRWNRIAKVKVKAYFLFIFFVKKKADYFAVFFEQKIDK